MDKISIISFIVSSALTIPFLYKQWKWWREIEATEEDINNKKEEISISQEYFNSNNGVTNKSEEDVSGKYVSTRLDIRLNKLLGREASLLEVKQIITSEFDDSIDAIRTNTNLEPSIALLCDFIGLAITLTTNYYVGVSSDGNKDLNSILFGFIPIVIPSIIGLRYYIKGLRKLKVIQFQIESLSNSYLDDFLDKDKRTVPKVEIAGQDKLSGELEIFSMTIRELNTKFKGFDRVFTGHINEFGNYTTDIKLQQEKFISDLGMILNKISEKQDSLIERLSENSLNNEKRIYELMQNIKTNTTEQADSLKEAINSLVEGIKPLSTFKDQIDTLNTQIENSTTNLMNTSRNANNLTDIVNNSLKEINIVTSELGRFNTSIESQIEYINAVIQKYDSQSLLLQQYFEKLDKVNAIKDSLDTLTNSISIPLDAISSNMTKDVLKGFSDNVLELQRMANQQNSEIKNLIENFNSYLTSTKEKERNISESNKRTNDLSSNSSAQLIVDKLDEIKAQLPSKWKIWPFSK